MPIRVRHRALQKVAVPTLPRRPRRVGMEAPPALAADDSPAIANGAAAASAAAAAPYGTNGRGLQWTTRIMQPGRARGTARDRARVVIHHRLTSLLCFGARAGDCARAVAGCLVGRTGPGAMSAWMHDAAAGALIVPLPFGAIPEALAGAHALHGNGPWCVNASPKSFLCHAYAFPLPCPR